MGRDLTTRQGVIGRAPNHVSQIWGFEGRGYEIEGSGFDDRHVKLGINFLSHHNHTNG
jgi:hypothetical protein